MGPTGTHSLPRDGEAKVCHRNWIRRSAETGVSDLLRTTQSIIRDCMTGKYGKNVHIKLYSQVGKAAPLPTLLLSRAK